MVKQTDRVRELNEQGYKSGKKSDHNISELIQSKDQLWLMKLPKNFDINDLNGLQFTSSINNIKSDGTSIGDSKYTITQEKNIEEIQSLVNVWYEKGSQGEMKIGIPFSKYITVEETIDIPETTATLEPTKKTIQDLSELKGAFRPPGGKYQLNNTIPQDVLEKMNKKKKKSTSTSTTSTKKQQPKQQVEEEEKSSKKKKSSKKDDKEKKSSKKKEESDEEMKEVASEEEESTKKSNKKDKKKKSSKKDESEEEEEEKETKKKSSSSKKDKSDDKKKKRKEMDETDQTQEREKKKKK
ncbi:hypothetical protein DFA_11377 [Cavenderia fasciculata]|uniref:Uncharacterized protein n=1 Tax=Cavenderia fasciculata TaxID=261658 RepID=F4QCN4_CACFS|nr:uncharacterized protein DFA_11377 [Cavenderia fasciculata]EGG13616.1 hypothetical protein DFA_11377 [Cavenderia fasciculata]|eukprot:XP_004350320.1 hypothetical protein DFA_11377 [Cavenderia fasciculata]